jgi:hypothetical protein
LIKKVEVIDKRIAVIDQAMNKLRSKV